MQAMNPLDRYQRFVAWGSSGSAEDVDNLMQALLLQDDLATTKLVDFALGLVSGHPGSQRIAHYLLNGALIQRNFAALYFKRRGSMTLLEEALAAGKIDWEQAFSK